MSDDENGLAEKINAFYKAEGIDIPEDTGLNTSSKPEQVETPKANDPMVALAKTYGWSEDGEKSAEEFIKYALDKHPERGKEIKELKRTVDELKVHMTKQEERAYARALKDLQLEQNQAHSRGDMDRVNEIQAEIAEMTPAPETHAAVAAFQERHEKWINGHDFDSIEIRNFALARDKELATLKLSPEEHMQTLEQHIHRKFPTYFNNVERTDNVVEANDNTVKPLKKKYSFNDLTKEQKKIARDFERYKIMDVDTYVQELVKSGDLV